MSKKPTKTAAKKGKTTRQNPTLPEIPAESESAQDKKLKFTAKQLQAIAILSAIPVEFEHMTDAAKKAGVHRSTLYEWLEDPDFKAEVARQTNRSYAMYGAQVRHAHIRRIIKTGDPVLIRLYYEHAEGWASKQKFEHDATPDFAALVRMAQQTK